MAIAPITGMTSMCAGSSFTLHDATAGGTWSTTSSRITIGSSSGIVATISGGTSLVTYTVGSAFVTTTVTVIATPTAYPVNITGGGVVCPGGAGQHIYLNSSDVGVRYTLYSPTPGASRVGTGGYLDFGLINTLGSYSMIGTHITAGCSRVMNNTVAIHPGTTPPAIIGPPTVCLGTTGSYSDVSAGGTWSIAGSIAGSIDAVLGTYLPTAAGTETISYSTGSGCLTTTTITVGSGTPASASGPSAVCPGATATFTATPSGGTWSSSLPSIAAIGTNGIATGVSPGSAVISYSVPACGGMYIATGLLSVTAPPPAILGPDTVCTGTTTTFSDATPGGTWSVAGMVPGSIDMIFGAYASVGTGAEIVSYTAGSGCYATLTITTSSGSLVTASGPSGICAGTTAAFTGSPSGGNWSSLGTTVATIGTSGLASGLVPGTTIITYTVPGCGLTTATSTLAVFTVPSVITGATHVCVGSVIPLFNTVAGGTWASGLSTVATIGSSSGMVSGITVGSTTVTYTLSGICMKTTTIAVNPLPTIAANSMHASCSSIFSLVATGGTSYSWAPSMGVACPACAVTTIDPAATTTFTVTASDVFSCVNTATTTVNGDRILGRVSFPGGSSDPVRVWLMQYDPADGSITDIDSTMACYSSTGYYYEFNGKPAGNYVARAHLLTGTPGVSGYIPTYSLSTPHWHNAATAVHIGNTDVLNISLIYGAGTSGVGSISGYVYLGAGKGTAGETGVAGLLIYLKDGSGNILTYTYTDVSGAYTFTGLAFNTYSIYPEDYHYSTTTSPSITLSESIPNVTGVSFRQNPAAMTIIPIDKTGVKPLAGNHHITVYPNPASEQWTLSWHDLAGGTAQIVVTDVLGREVYRSAIDINSANGNTKISIAELANGIYHLSVTAGAITCDSKLRVQK